MEEEWANKRPSFPGHLLAVSWGGVVFEGEGDLGIVKRQDALVGNGVAMGITTQITEDIFGAGEGRFGVDDPVLLIEWVEELAPSAGLAQFGSAASQLELAGLVGLA